MNPKSVVILNALLPRLQEVALCTTTFIAHQPLMKIIGAIQNAPQRAK